MKRFLISYILFTILTGCMDRIDIREFAITNKTKYNIFCIISSSDLIKDSRINFDEDTFNKCLLIEKDSSSNLFDRPRNWEIFITHQCKDNKMRLFIVSKDSVDKYGWQEVINKNIFNKVYRFNIDDLNKINWRINFTDN